MANYYDRQGNPMTLMEFADAMESASDAKKKGNGRHVGYTETNDHLVSTVWLGVDHNFDVDGPPLIFETMIFCQHDEPCELGEECWRYSTETEAETGHLHAVTLAEAAVTA
jgi:hypothetical protein